MIVKICVGSSCHLKGSYDVIEAFKSLLSKYEVEDKVELQASFCLGNCARGVSVQMEECNTSIAENDHISIVDGGIMLHQVTAENAEALFTKEVLPLI